MREKLIELLEQAKFCSTEELADYLIAAGLTLPVRCEECKHWDAKHCSDGQGWCPKVVGYRYGGWFCAGGERKDND